jgi:hypothetical protein
MPQRPDLPAHRLVLHAGMVMSPIAVATSGLDYCYRP